MDKFQLNSVPDYIWMSTIDLANVNSVILGTDLDPQNNGVGHLLGSEKQWVVLAPSMTMLSGTMVNWLMLYEIHRCALAKKHPKKSSKSLSRKAWQQTLRYVKQRNLPWFDTILQKSLREVSDQMTEGNMRHFRHLWWGLKLLFGAIGQFCISFGALAAAAAIIIPQEHNFVPDFKFWLSYFQHSATVIVGIILITLFTYVFPVIKERISRIEP